MGPCGGAEFSAGGHIRPPRATLIHCGGLSGRGCGPCSVAGLEELLSVQCPGSPPGRRGRTQDGQPGAFLQKLAHSNLHVAVTGCCRKRGRWALVCSRPSSELAWGSAAADTHLSWKPPSHMPRALGRVLDDSRKVGGVPSHSAQRTLTRSILLRPRYCL